MISLLLDDFETTSLRKMTVPPARYRALQYNLSTANQISGLLSKIEFDAVWVFGLLRKGRSCAKGD